jgi:prohibitin 2
MNCISFSTSGNYEQIAARLAAYNIIVDGISITEFQFSPEFVRAVETKVAAQQRALQAQNELRRIEIEAQQAEARAVGEQQANIARAEGVRQANVLQAQGEDNYNYNRRAAETES